MPEIATVLLLCADARAEQLRWRAGGRVIPSIGHLAQPCPACGRWCGHGGRRRRDLPGGAAGGIRLDPWRRVRRRRCPVPDRRDRGRATSNRREESHVDDLPGGATDLFGDGLLIGAGSAVSSGLGPVLAAGQVLADLPEGFAAMSTLRANDVDRRRRLLLSASFLIPVLVAAVLSFLLLLSPPESARTSRSPPSRGAMAVRHVVPQVRIGTGSFPSMAMVTWRSPASSAPWRGTRWT